MVEFESCVVSDGNQTTAGVNCMPSWFESCVVSDGNQTKALLEEFADSV